MHTLLSPYAIDDIDAATIITHTPPLSLQRLAIDTYIIRCHYADIRHDLRHATYVTASPLIRAAFATPLASIACWDAPSILMPIRCHYITPDIRHAAIRRAHVT